MHALLLAALLATLPLASTDEVVVSVQMLGGAERSTSAVVRARASAIQMFATAGIRLEWCETAHRCTNWDGRFVVTLKETAPRHLPAGARASARVFQGRDIEIYVDRMANLPRALAPAIWAHVLVHEITHLLQGCDHHSPTGIMKARWDTRDQLAMPSTPLPFTSYDLLLIRSGLNKRGSVPPPPAVD